MMSFGRYQLGVFLAGVALAFAMGSFAACSGGEVPPPDGKGGAGGGTGGDGGGGGIGGDGGVGGIGGQGGVGGTGGGGSCTSAADCDDGIPCSIDRCLGAACYHELDNTLCPSYQYCEPAVSGCVDAPACENDIDCDFVFIDHPCIATTYCKAATKTCSFWLLDGDADGHPPLSCGGDDCNDDQFEMHPGLPEICDGLDNDCEGTVDVAPEIDFSSPTTCGTCVHNCYVLLVNVDPASITCEPSPKPQIEPGKCTGTCANDYYDLDKDPVGTCEYYCVKSGVDDSTCNNKDDDCDGAKDEDVDVCTSTTDCGKCGNNCFVINGTAACVNNGNQPCTVNNTQCKIAQCNPGFWDLDGSYVTGCEYACTLTNGGAEKCADGIDNDCDGQIDEGC